MNTDTTISSTTTPSLLSFNPRNATPTSSISEHTASMTDTNTGVVVDQLPLTVAQAPSLCRLCNVQLLGLQTWRAHVKSDGQYVCPLLPPFAPSAPIIFLFNFFFESNSSGSVSINFESR